MNTEIRVVITGIGTSTAAGNSDALWEASINKSCCLTYPENNRSACLSERVVGKVDIDAISLLPSRTRKYASRHCQLGASAINDCIKDARYNCFSDGRSGFVFGSASHGLDRLVETFDEMATRPFNEVSYKVVNSTSNGGACRILAEHFNINGYVHSVEGASCTGMIALHSGYSMIKAGLCDRVLCAVGEATLFPAAMLFYNRKIRINGMVYTFFGKKNKPAFRVAEDYVVPFCRPDVSDRGAIAEGGAAILLESERSALNRGADIHAELENISLYFQNTGASPHVAPLPGIYTALRNLGPLQFDSVYFPVTGCYPLDNQLYTACSKLYPGIHAATVEPVIGHTGAAAPLVNVILAVKSLQKQTLIPTCNTNPENFDPVFCLSPSAEPIICHRISRILVAGIGWGGYNGACSVAQYRAT